MSGKKDLIVEVMQTLIGKVDTKDLKAIEDSFWQVSFNFSIEPITDTEVATTDHITNRILHLVKLKLYVHLILIVLYYMK